MSSDSTAHRKRKNANSDTTTIVDDETTSKRRLTEPSTDNRGGTVDINRGGTIDMSSPASSSSIATATTATVMTTALDPASSSSSQSAQNLTSESSTSAERIAASAMFCGLLSDPASYWDALSFGKKHAEKGLLDCSRPYAGHRALTQLIVSSADGDSSAEAENLVTDLFNLIIACGCRPAKVSMVEGGTAGLLSSDTSVVSLQGSLRIPALLFACFEPPAPVVARLIASLPDVDVNCRYAYNDAGSTPLILSVENGLVDVARVLLSRTADIDLDARTYDTNQLAEEFIEDGESSNEFRRMFEEARKAVQEYKTLAPIIIRGTLVDANASFPIDLLPLVLEYLKLPPVNPVVASVFSSISLRKIIHTHVQQTNASPTL